MHKTYGSRLVIPKRVAGAFVLALVAYPAWTYASSVALPHVFGTSEPVSASKVNENFAAVKAAVDDNAGQIAALQAPKITLTGLSTQPLGGGSNAWKPGARALLTSAGSYPASLVSGQPFTGEITLQTADSRLGGDRVGPPLSGGTLVFDLEWVFVAGAPFSLHGTTVVPAVATVQINPGTFNNTTVQFSGVVPSPPSTPGGFTTTHLGAALLKVNPATTAKGQAVTCLDLYITPK